MAKTKDTMIIAQMTDLHIGFEGEGEVCHNSRRLRMVIRELNSMVLKPDIVLLTGDLVESGESWAYAKLKKELSKLDYPVYYAMGNHDHREIFGMNFPEAEFNDGFLQYTIEDWPVRVIVLDTLNNGFHGGAFCEKRKAWLEARLAEQPDRPTFIAMHHPPIESGIAWMTASLKAPWVMSLRETIRKYDNILHVTAGHIHRTIFKKFENTTISVCRAVAPQVKLELADIDPNTPDDRVLLVDTTPGYCLHHWNGHILTTHAANAPSGKPVIKYDEAHAFVVKHTLDMG